MHSFECDHSATLGPLPRGFSSPAAGRGLSVVTAVPYTPSGVLQAQGLSKSPGSDSAEGRVFVHSLSICDACCVSGPVIELRTGHMVLPS